MGDAALEARLRRLGATHDEIEAARERGRLLAFTIELLVSPDRGLTLDELASKAGMARADVLRLWSAWGFPPPEPDDRRFGERDAGVMPFALAIEQVVDPRVAYHTARVMSMAIGRVAEAEVSMLRSALEAPLREGGAGDDTAAEHYEAVVPAAMRAADKALLSLHRHHLVETARRHADWGVQATPHNLLDIVVGFADLTGSTSLAAASALDELDHALSVFEERTADVLADAGATLVKRIGDAVMFTTPAAPVGARVAVELVCAFSADPVVPPVRVGLAAGQVVARRGDFYGLPVALAARLQSLARPSSVLLDAEMYARLDATSRERTGIVGVYEIAGFPDPVDVYELQA